jgi:hypothetical protein
MSLFPGKVTCSLRTHIGQGIYREKPDKTSYLHGEVVQLAAVPDEGGTVSWTERLLVMQSRQYYDECRSFSNCHFSIKKFTVTASSNPQLVDQ